MKPRTSTPHLHEQIREEAAEWFIAFCDDDVDERGREEFNLWLRRSPEHVRAYLRLAAFWGDDELLTRTRKLDADSLVRRALEESNIVVLSEEHIAGHADVTTRASPSDASRSRRPGLSMRAAVGIGVVAVIAVTWYRQLQPTYVTAVGEQRTVTLSDGSTMSLNARSKVYVRFGRSQREVDLLDGEALFHVAKNPVRPFIVHSGATNIRAVGTQFDVYHKAAETLVSVIEGRVAVTNPADPQNSNGSQISGKTLTPSTPAAEPRSAYVSAGEQILATPHALMTPTRTSVAAATAWLEGKLVFEDTPLIDVIDEFNRHNARRLIIDDDAQLRAVRISGIFSFTDSAQLVEFLRQRMSLVVHDSDDEIRISRR
jgi:transmembrane sensor